jgi:hypothetical protein
MFPANTWSFVASAEFFDDHQSFTWTFEALPNVNVSVALGSGRLCVTVATELDFDAFDEPLAIATAERVVDRLAYEFDVPVGPARLSGSAFKDGRCTAHAPTVRRIVRSVPGDDALRRLVHERWGSESNELAAACHLYREALLTTDPIAGFLLLWNLLVMLSGDDVAADLAVRRSSPKIAIVQTRPRGECSVVLDTRDQIAHMVQRPEHRPAPSARLLREAVAAAMPHLRLAARIAVAEIGPEGGNVGTPVEQAHRADNTPRSR